MIRVYLKLLNPPLIEIPDINPMETIETLKDLLSGVRHDLDVSKFSFFCGGRHLYDFNQTFNFYEIEDGDNILVMNVDVILFGKE